jgi:uncharacterized repeat protein (TIGR03803 family)
LAIIVIALSLASFASAQATETVLFNFGAPHSGIGPQGPLVFDAAGNLYGTTESGGTFGWGTVFKLAPSAVGGWTQTEIHTFTGAKDGGAPYAGLTIDAAGNLYGTTVGGGDLGCTEGGCGTVFELSPNSSGKWTETVLYAFKGTDGAAPQATVVFDALGNLYGTTNAGGQRGAQGYGTVFRLAPSSGGWQESVLHVFADGSDGAYPVAPLVVDAAGNLYGTAAKGGNNCNLSGCGVVFELSLASSGEWRETVLHSFKGGKDGAVPLAGLTLDGSGNLYGTTVYGGVANGCPSSGTAGCGVVFEILPSASGWKENVLHIFTGAQDGGGPGSGITLDAAGNLYGTTEAGGLSTCSTFYTGCGIVFELTPRTGGGWKENVLHAFRDGRDGANPASGLIFDAAGNLYGVSSGGGPKRACSYGCGTAFELTSSTSQ